MEHRITIAPDVEDEAATWSAIRLNSDKLLNVAKLKRDPKTNWLLHAEFEIPKLTNWILLITLWQFRLFGNWVQPTWQLLKSLADILYPLSPIEPLKPLKPIRPLSPTWPETPLSPVRPVSPLSPKIK